ncbi:MAG: hypothetical protein BIFFINMI_00366 [Phycisphaerae bacterium]|nr:hypothetical protein [Phycisphaerae bacterium]
MFSFKVVASVLLVGLLGGVALAADAICDLTLAERFGIARQNEPVRMGVPLAEGVAKDAAQLALTDASGQPIPVQIDPAMTWPDGSLRWVHVNFVASVPANGKTVVHLVNGAPARSDSQADATSAFDAGSPKVALMAMIGGKPYTSFADKAAKAEVVVKGPERVILRRAGRLTSADGGEQSLNFTIYETRYAGSPRVDLSVSYTNEMGKAAADHVEIQDLTLVVESGLKQARFAIGGEKGAQAGQLGDGESASVQATASKSVVIKKGDTQLEQFDPILSKPLTVGWAALSNDKGGLAVGCRWFWQMWPKDITVSGDGMIRVGLYSAAASGGKALDCYMGQGRTHYVTVQPFAAGDADKVASAMTAWQVPLRAVATPAYYCRTAAGFGLVGDNDPAIYPADLKPVLAGYDATLRKSLDYIVKKKDGCTYGGVTKDSYGYNYWGDVFHWANISGDPDPRWTLWESNYYDFPFACMLQFARTGDEAYLDVADPHGLHLADVFMCKWDPQPMYRGACRYSPPADEVGNDMGKEKAFQPYRSVEFNHHKAQSIVYRYLLLGDLRAKDDFLLALNNALLNPEESWRQCRGPGAKLATLYEGYKLTHDKACLDVMKRIMTKAEALTDNPKGFSKQGKSGYFMMGIAREGMLDWWQLTKDDKAVAVVKSITDFLLTGGGGLQGAQDAYPLAYCYRSTGEQAYRDAAVKLLTRTGTEQRPKGFGMSWRSTPYAWYYLSDLAAKDKAGK